jgi:demethylmenaquinone methyltransferase/2-methoxy-6-polyprenyl-1,4-benzoquinol methylase
MAHAGQLEQRYDRAAGRWRDKMRALGYYDGYLGFLSAPGPRAGAGASVIDAGAGTAAFSEAWVAVNGAPESLTLIEPSGSMLARGVAALRERGVEPEALACGLDEAGAEPADEVLVAHLIEHFDDPEAALHRLRRLTRPGGILRLVVSKPHWCNAIIWLQWRHRTFTGAELHGMLKRTGFAVERDYAFPSGPPSRTSHGVVARAV